MKNKKRPLKPLRMKQFLAAIKATTTKERKEKKRTIKNYNPQIFLIMPDDERDAEEFIVESVVACFNDDTAKYDGLMIHIRSIDAEWKAD